MVFFLLPKIQPRITHPHIRIVVFERRTDMLSALHIIPLRLVQHKRVNEKIQIFADGIVGNRYPFYSSKGVRYFYGICQRADRRGHNIKQIVEHRFIITDFMSCHNVVQINLIK